MLIHDCTTGTDLMSQIPPELLGEIFSYSTLLDPNAPLVLGEVSRTFHRIVRTTPQAWIRLRLSMYQADMHMDPDAKCIRKAELWFAMAAVLPIDVEVEISSLPAPSSDKARNHTHIFINHRNQKTDDPLESQTNFADMFLPQVLRSYNQRIRALELRTTTVNEAQAFLSTLYPVDPSIAFSLSDMHLDSCQSAQELPLESLILHASSDGSKQHSHRPHCRVTKTTPCITLPNLPHLAHLKFHNHILPHLSVDNVKNLRSLSIVYPLRFSPLSIYTLFHVLGSATSLQSLEIEGRVVEGLLPPSLPPTPTLTPLSPSFDQRVSSDVTPSADSSASMSYPSLITLRNLTHLHLRVNNLPAILSHLLLPSLHTLKVDDLDGNRPGAAQQMAEVFRGLLVRMELPCEGRRGKGLKVLDLCNVAVSGTGVNANAGHRLDNTHSLHHGNTCDDGYTGGPGIDSEKETAETIWRWCFRRMLKLEELIVKKMDIGALVDIITPRVNATTSSWSESDGYPSTAVAKSTEDVPLPGLRKLCITDYVHHHTPVSDFSSLASGSRSPPPTSSLSPFSPFSFSSPPPSPLVSSSFLSPYSTDTTASIKGPILKFQMRRPDVVLVHNAIPVPASVRPRPTQPNVDFLDFYGH